MDIKHAKVHETIVCYRCGLVDDYILSKAGPHIKATCNGCGRYIKFVNQISIINQDLNLNFMASDKIIHIRINVEKINKKWLYKGEKGTYLDVTCFYNEEQDEHGQNGMVVQSVPSDIYKKEKDLPKDDRSKGEILGNAKEFSKVNMREESTPGYTGSSKKKSNKKEEEEDEEWEQKEAASNKDDDDDDDLPF
jgi:hypothetical protein